MPPQGPSRIVSVTLAVHMLDSPSQVRHAQKGLPTGSVYTTNERNLATVGVGELQTMLDDRDWTKIFAKAFAAHSENTWK